MKKEEFVEAQKKQKEVEAFKKKVEKRFKEVYKKISKITGVSIKNPLIDDCFDDVDILNDSFLGLYCDCYDCHGEDYKEKIQIKLNRNETFSPIVDGIPRAWLWEDFEDSFKKEWDKGCQLLKKEKEEEEAKYKEEYRRVLNKLSPDERRIWN